MYTPMPFEEVFITVYWLSVITSCISEIVRGDEDDKVVVSLGLVLTPIINTYLALHFIGIILYHIFRRRR